MEENDEKNSEILSDEKAEEEEPLDIPENKRNIYTDTPKVN